MRRSLAVLLLAASLFSLVAASSPPSESALRLAGKSTAVITLKDVSASYKSLVDVIGAADRSRATVCKTAKCTVLDGAKAWGQTTYVEVKPYQALAITKLKKKFTGAIAVLGKSSAFALSSSTLALIGSKIQATDSNTWFTLVNAALGLASSQIVGSFRSFSLTKSQIGFDKSQVDLVNSVVVIKPGSKLVIRDTGFRVNATAAGSYPFVVSGSGVAITRGVILFKNVDAYFYQSTVSFDNVQLVLINARVTFIGGTFSSTNSVSTLSSGSTLTFSKVAFIGDRYLSRSFGFPSLPKAFPKPYKAVGAAEFAVSGTGNVTLRSAAS